MEAYEVYDRAVKEKYNKIYFEKAYRTATLLKELEKIDDFRNSFVCKGGLAVTLYSPTCKRLFSDVDLDYAIPGDEESMHMKRLQLEQTIINCASDLGYPLSTKSRFSYGMDSYVFGYQNLNHQSEYVKLDMNYSLRSHVLKPNLLSKKYDIFDMNMDVRTVHFLELLALKITVLLQRKRAKDLYDVYVLLKEHPIEDLSLLRKMVLFHESISSTYNHYQEGCDYLEEMNSINERNQRKTLSPLFQKQSAFCLESAKDEILSFLRDLLILEKYEKRYLESFYKGAYKPEYLFSNEYAENIEKHPMALYKISHIRKNL